MFVDAWVPFSKQAIIQDFTRIDCSAGSGATAAVSVINKFSEIGDRRTVGKMYKHKAGDL